MRNHDEALLRSRRVEPRAPFPPLHQALRIALYDLYAARAFYGRVIEAFGPKAPFPALLKAREGHIAALTALCGRFGLPRPQDPFPLETTLAPAWSANCRRALAGEAGTAALVDNLLPHAPYAEAAKALRRIQRDSLATHIPALEGALAKALDQEWLHASQGVPPAEAYMEHGFFSDFMEKAFSVLGSHHQAFGVVGPLIGNTRPAMLAGLLVGGAGTYLARNRLRQKRKEK